ncbi:MAG TPA: DegT/DnrJ/EryC1/StrS family aminotransferase [Candidatus Tumulicola sp.]|jgi:dTDP-4-amino-4,6-dideoxygalactose transaminase
MAEPTLPVLDLRRQYAELAGEIARAVTGVFESGVFINGRNVAEFEREFAGYVGTEFAVGLNSGTDALHLALRALDIGPGDDVVTTPFTFAATAEAIGMVGARPVFADIDPRTYALDPRAAEAAITPRTKAILPVHLYGLPADMGALAEVAARRGLALVEDCAQSVGAKFDGRMTGSFGQIGCFSFFPSKNLGAYGDGGMLVTSDPAIAKRVRSLRAHGAAKKYYHEELGVNSRLDELQAAILRVKLPHLERWNRARRAAAHRYDGLLAGIAGLDLPVVPDGRECVYHQYTVAVEDRDRVRADAKARGVETMVYYPVPLHLQLVAKDLGIERGAFPIAEAAADRVLSLPMFPELRPDEIARAAAALTASIVGAEAALSA